MTAGSLLLVAAGVVPVWLWPQDGSAARQQLAITAGACCLLAGLACWIGAALVKRGSADG